MIASSSGERAKGSHCILNPLGISDDFHQIAESCDLTAEPGERGVREALRASGKTALLDVIVCRDQMGGIAAVKHLRDCGLQVPGAIGVETIQQRLKDGRIAGNQIVLPVELQVGGSTCRPVWLHAGLTKRERR